MAIGIELPIAFFGGILALLSPCSALLIPAFFAYAFPSRGQLMLRTSIFFLGLITVLIPVGLGVGALGSIILERRAEVTLIAGLFLIGIGVYQLAIGGFEVPGSSNLMGRVSGDSAIATYALGAVYGIAGFCAGPILGGVLTIAATSGGAVTGGFLLFVYALGMAVPLFILAATWERIGPWARSHVSAGEWHIGRWSRPRVTVISSLMFIILGFAFIIFQGSNAFSGIYESFGASDASAAVETSFNDLVRSQGDIVAVSSLAVVLGIVVIIGIRLWRGKTGGPGGDDGADDLDDLDEDYELDEPTPSAKGLH
jgi:cytochrome c biogenesis protein CcdA